jgi:hypothetical protein
MNIPDEIQTEINKAKKIESDLTTNLKNRINKAERGLNTSSV